MTQPLKPQHSPDCSKGHFANMNISQRKVFGQIVFSKRWDCPKCKADKLGDLTEMLVTRVETLCWGPWTASKNNSPRKVFTLRFSDDSPIMVAESHLFEPQLPSDAAMLQVVEYALDRSVSNLNWSDKWRMKKETHPENWDGVFPKNKKSLVEINAAIKRAGLVDGNFGRKSAFEVKDSLEQIINGSSFNS